jgi:SEC-C motif-containing protein
MTLCPCQSGKAFSDCCAPFLDGVRLPVTTEQLMRSRFCAYRLGRWDYVLYSWHPDHRPALSVEQLAAEQADGGWERLQVLEARGGAGDEQGEVRFCAWYRDQQGLHAHHESSRFVHWESRWVYTEGDLLPPPRAEKVKPNTPCPCGSGLKYKKCCGRQL